MVEQYLTHSREILASPYSQFKGGSKGMGLISIFGYQDEYDLREGFPLLTTKKMFIDSITHELIWFFKGETNIKYLADNNVHIWDGNAFDHNLEGMAKEGIFPEGIVRYSSDWHSAKTDYIQRIKEDGEFSQRWGDLGPVYGSQWRHWRYADEDTGEIVEVDQIEELLNYLRKNPEGKRAIVTAWNPGEVPKTALPPCHMMWQVNLNDEGMDLKLFQRSCDMFLGVPYNIASYSMVTQIIANQLGVSPRRFIHSFGDSHFYTGDGDRSNWYGENFQELRRRVIEVKEREDYLEVLDWINSSAPEERSETEGQDHVTAILEQLSREPRELPRREIADKRYNELTIDDFTLAGYDPHPFIKRAMAV